MDTNKMKLAIVVSEFHPEICNSLVAGARSYLEENSIPFCKEDVFYAPGAFEVPLLAKRIAISKKYDGIITIACIIKGETAHFEYISSAVALGIQMVALETQIPISFGVLTTYTREDAEKRARPGENNKGTETAQACLRSVQALQQWK